MEELDFQGVLDKFGQDGFQKGEQVILGNFGTNQTLLSLIFQKPVNVKNIHLEEVKGVITQDVDLITGEQVIGHATTHIPRDRNSQQVWDAVRAGQLGLGQIVVTYSLPTKRVLVDVGRDDQAFWCTYTIEGADVFLEIYEHYPRPPFEAIGWLRKSGSSMSVTDDEGETTQFSKFVAIGVQEDGAVFLGIEDEGLTRQEAMEVVLQGAQVVGEIANGITSGQIQVKEVGHGDYEHMG